MKSKDRIYLVGMPGCGKSTLGKQLAEKLGLKFIDLDDAIETELGMTIRAYFEKQGEGNFRIQEREVLHSISAIDDGFVMATGGGAPCFHFNMDFMKDHGTTVFLDVTPGDLALRLIDEGLDKRPLFQSYDHQDLIAELRTMQEKRGPYYSEADVKIKNNRITVDSIVSHLS
ncbi:MAG: shikimate kinase [Roseivirga sp.]